MKVKIRALTSWTDTVNYYYRGKEYEVDEVQAIKFETAGMVKRLEVDKPTVRRVITGKKS